MNSTTTAACEIHTNLEPLGQRREAAVVEMTERYKRMDISHPNRKIVDTRVPRNRIHQRSILDAAKKIEEKHHLPQNREPLKPIHAEIPPNTLRVQTSRKHSKEN
jgi:hypothetical protein